MDKKDFFALVDAHKKAFPWACGPILTDEQATETVAVLAGDSPDSAKADAIDELMRYASVSLLREGK